MRRNSATSLPIANAGYCSTNTKDPEGADLICSRRRSTFMRRELVKKIVWYYTMPAVRRGDPHSGKRGFAGP